MVDAIYGEEVLDKVTQNNVPPLAVTSIERGTHESEIVLESTRNRIWCLLHPNNAKPSNLIHEPSPPHDSDLKKPNGYSTPALA